LEGVVTALNREGKRTRGWEPVEVNGRVVRKGKPAAERTAVTVRRVPLQPINEGTVVYNRRKAKGRTHVARPEAEHVVVEKYCEPISSREEMDELRHLAAEIEGEAPCIAPKDRGQRTIRGIGLNRGRGPIHRPWRQRASLRPAGDASGVYNAAAMQGTLRGLVGMGAGPRRGQPPECPVHDILA
jgi:hypothetical protein